jgi:tRNA_anti-like
MTKTHTTPKAGQWLQLICSAGLLIVFFLPWAAWKDSLISGYHLPSGHFFKVSETQFNLANPFPQINFSFYIFWLIPVLAVVSGYLVWQQKNTIWTSFITGALTLSLVAIFFLFSKTLIDLGVGNSPFSMLQIPAYLAAFFAAGLILTASPAGKWPLRLLFLVAGPVFAFLGFMIIEKKVWGETFADTDTVKADYTITAPALIREFAANDTAANRKYREKIIAVDGQVAQVETLADSTVNIKFTDSSKYFINFSLDKKDYAKTQLIKPGDPISVKGSCSGSSYSMILDSSSIDFKRSTLNKK